MFQIVEMSVTFDSTSHVSILLERSNEVHKDLYYGIGRRNEGYFTHA